MGQQRTSTPRRSLNPATRPSYNDIAWLPVSKAGADVTCQLSQDSASLVRTGVPQIKALSIDAFPDSVVWSGSTMILTYPSALADPESFVCAIQTPQIRSYSGGYLAAATLGLGNPTPVPIGTIFAPYCSGTDLRGAIADGAGGTADGLVSADSPGCGFLPAPPPAGWCLAFYCTGFDLWGDIANGTGGVTPGLIAPNTPGCGSLLGQMAIAWIPSLIDANNALITLDPNSSGLTLNGTPAWQNLDTGGDTAVTTIIGTNLNLYFPLGISTGQRIQYSPGIIDNVLNLWGQQPYATAIAVP